MFENKIFTVLKSNISESGEISGRIKLNPYHEVFKGHFPNNPVLPGVVSIQIVLEFFSKVLNTNHTIIEAQNIKFLKIIDPQIHRELNIIIKYSPLNSETYKITAEIVNEDSSFFKFSGKYLKK
jgi:3-hydroxyacyl-[acyl-carrier-protein] dehydratase